MARRKRIDPETDKLRQENTILARGLNALVNGEVQWYGRATEKGGGGSYRFGISFLRHGALLFIAFTGRTERRSSTQVHDLDAYLEDCWRRDFDGMTAWYKLAGNQIAEASRMHREYLKRENR